MGWGAGQGNGGTQAMCLSACLSTVCVCVCLRALWVVLVAMRLEGRGARTPPPHQPLHGEGSAGGLR